MENLRLRKALESKRQRSTGGRHFVTYADQKAVFTEGAIQRLVSELECRSEQKVGLARTLYEEGTTILAILVWMKEVDSVFNFRKHSLLDSQLPLGENRAIQIAPGFGSSLAKEVQWQFLPYFFKNSMCEADIVIQNATILPFVKEEPLGEGAFGAVYKMTLPCSQHEFKLDSDKKKDYSSIVRKRIKSHKMRHAIEQELKCLLLLHRSRHPNIVSFLGSYELNNEHNFLFPCFEMDLNEMLKREGRFGNFEWDFTFFAALAGLASAMNNLHQLELTPEVDGMKFVANGYHNDFRPANILVSHETFLLTDFGLSKLKPNDQTSQTIWTANMGDYIAPECMDLDFEPQKIGRPVDTWALGCLLFEVATYMERGPKGLEHFRKDREGPGLMVGWTDRKFCGKDGVRPVVQEWYQELIVHPKIPLLADLLQIAIDTLQINPLNRPKAGAINEQILFPSVKAHFDAMQSAFSEYVELELRQKDINTPPKSILYEKERVHAFGTVLGLDEGRRLFYPKLQDMEIMCNTLKTLFHIFRSEITQVSKNGVHSSIEKEVSVFVQLLWDQVPPRFKEKMEIELRSREDACVNSLLQGEESHTNSIEIFFKTPQTFAWIQRNPRYEDWLGKNSSSLLWVLEAGGRSKTTLASFLLGELTRRSQSDKNVASIVTRVFCGIRSVDKKDATWILRNIIHQLLMNDKVLMQRHALPAYQKRRRENPIWSFKDANHLFQGVMCDRRSPIYLILDLFDESERVSQGDLLGAFEPFLSNKDPAPPFKVVIITKAYSRAPKHLGEYLQMEIRWNRVEVGEIEENESKTDGEKSEDYESNYHMGDRGAVGSAGYGEISDGGENAASGFSVPHFIRTPQHPRAILMPPLQNPQHQRTAFKSPHHNPQKPRTTSTPPLKTPQHPRAMFMPPLQDPSTDPPTFTSTCPRSFIAACKWAESDYRVYFQDSLHNIQEASKINGNWNIMAGHMGINDAKSNTPLTVTARFGGDNREIRLFYLNSRNAIRERCYLKRCGWTPGTLNKHDVSVAEDSSLTTVSWSSGLHVYYQSVDGVIKKYYFSEQLDDWVKSEQIADSGGKILTAAIKSSSLAAVTYLDTTERSIHLFFQGSDSKVKEVIEVVKDKKKTYMNGTLPDTKALDCTPLAAIAWNGNSPRICVFWQSTTKRFCEFRGPKQWILCANSILKSMMGETDIDLAAVEWNTGSRRKIYKMSQKMTVGELNWEDGRWVSGGNVQ